MGDTQNAEPQSQWDDQGWDEWSGQVEESFQIFDEFRETATTQIFHLTEKLQSVEDSQVNQKLQIEILQKATSSLQVEASRAPEVSLDPS